MLNTPRLLLRPWRDTDREPFAALNADPRVMRYFPALLTRAESDQLADRCTAHLAEHGFTFFAIELRETGEFIGFTGIAHTTMQAHFTPAVEIGWRMAYDHWNRGYPNLRSSADLNPSRPLFSAKVPRRSPLHFELGKGS
jgi:RimJ/RimL family protein N-acetyltransferase